MSRRCPTFDEPVALLAQTTLSHRDWDGVAVAVRERFPDVWSPGRSDLCFATTNRQSALMALAGRCDAIVDHRLGELVEHRRPREAGPRVGLPDRLSRSTPPTSCRPTSCRDARVVGVTAGASAPDELVTAVIDRLDPTDGVEVVRVTTEDEYFPPPRKLRELQAAIEHDGDRDARRLADRPAPGRRSQPGGQRRPRRARRLTIRPCATVTGWTLMQVRTTGSVGCG